MRYGTDLSSMNLTLTYWEGENLPITTTGIEVYTNPDQNDSSGGGNLTYDAVHKVLLASTNNNVTNNHVHYSIEKNVNKVTFGDIAWNTTTPARSGEGYTFSAGTNINTDNLSFTGTASALDESMTLVSDATGAASITTQNVNANIDVNYTDDAAGINYTGTATTGTISGTGTNLKYTITGGELNTINLNGWGGTGGIALPTNWTPVSGGITVDTGNFDTPTSIPGTGYIDIFVTNTPHIFSGVTGPKEFKDNVEVPDDEDKGVTLSGTKSGGVKLVEDEQDQHQTLRYQAETFDVNKVTLGDDVEWGNPRDLTGTTNDFTGVTSIDTENLHFDINDAKAEGLGGGSTTNILTGATGLQAGLDVVGSSHTQEDIGYTATNGATLTGTLKGTVSTVTDKVQYTVDDMTLDNVTLSGWNGTTSAVPTGWTKNDPIQVNTQGMDVSTVPPGTTPNILTTNTDNYFTDAVISEPNKYKSYNFDDDEANGVTLGDITWHQGGTARPLTGAYDFSGVASIDATKLNITVEETDADTLAAGNTMTLLSGATGIDANTGVQGSPRTQTVGYTATNGVGISGEMTGEVTTATDTVNYQVTDVTLSSLDLSGWNGTSSAAVPSWTPAAGGITVKGTFDAPDLTLGTSQDIMTATTGGYFTNANIDVALGSWEPPYSETANTITLTGQKSQGVAANNDGTALVYRADKAYIENIAPGAGIREKHDRCNEKRSRLRLQPRHRDRHLVLHGEHERKRRQNGAGGRQHDPP